MGDDSGGAGGWVYTGGVDSYNSVIEVINQSSPEESELLVKAIGGDGFHCQGRFQRFFQMPRQSALSRRHRASQSEDKI